jgi:hypothetical protein
MFQRFIPPVALVLALAGLWVRPLPAADPERQLPDYSGREPPPTSLGDVLLWVPRVILFPVYLVTEYVVRIPLGLLISGAERANVPEWLYDFFTFGASHEAGIFPTAYVDFDFYPSVGLYGYWNDALVKGHDLRLRGDFGGREWLATSFSERYRFSHDPYDRLALEGTLERRPDYAFFGIGPETRQRQLTRYGWDLREARALFDERLWRLSALHLQATLRDVDFRRGGYEHEPRLVDAIASGALPVPPSFASGYGALIGEASLALDTRRPRPEPASGVRLEARAQPAARLDRSGGFVRYGAGLGGFWDIGETHRVVSLSVQTRFADPIGGAEIPFTELVTLGGTEPMHGLYPGRLHDRSAFVTGLAYRWPIWIWLDGSLRSEVGNVFGEHLDGFRVERLRWSGALGVESNGSPDNSFQFLIGAGSETFDSGGKIDSLRVAVGATHGF